MHVATGGLEVGGELLQQVRQVGHDVGFDRRTGVAQLLPVWDLADDVVALRADRVCGVVNVFAHLRVLHLMLRRSRKWGR